MNLQLRDKKIRQYKEQGKTLSWIASRPEVNLSAERVRQIINEPRSRQELYDKIEKSYDSQIINKADYHWLKDELKRLAVHDRRKEVVIQRRALVKYLVDKMGFSFFQVGVLAQRHHTTIMNLYYNK